MEKSDDAWWWRHMVKTQLVRSHWALEDWSWRWWWWCCWRSERWAEKSENAWWWREMGNEGEHGCLNGGKEQLVEF